MQLPKPNTPKNLSLFQHHKANPILPLGLSLPQLRGRLLDFQHTEIAELLLHAAIALSAISHHFCTSSTNCCYVLCKLITLAACLLRAGAGNTTD